MSNELLSIIVPVYNVEKYLDRCIESIFKQTYNNLEIILVDDGSKDNSGKMCDEYALNDSRVIAIHQNNKGLSGARNTGIEIATGEYIAFVDSDDWIVNNTYEKMMTLIKKNDLDIVACAVCETDTIDCKHILFKDNYINRVIKDDDIFECYFKGMLGVVVWNKIYKREIIQDIKFPERYNNEDNYASGRYLFRAKRMMVINECLYYYFINKNGISAAIGRKNPLDLCICTDKLIHDLQKEAIVPNKFMKMLNNKQAKGLYHFIRDNRVIAISTERKNYVIKYLDLRRKVCFRLMLWKKRIRIYKA